MTAATTNVDKRTIVHLHAGGVIVDDKHVPVTNGESPHAAAIGWIATNRAQPNGQPVPVRAYEDGGTIYDFLVFPDGTLGNMEQVKRPEEPPRPSSQQPTPPEPVTEPLHEQGRQPQNTPQADSQPPVTQPLRQPLPQRPTMPPEAPAASQATPNHHEQATTATPTPSSQEAAAPGSPATSPAPTPSSENRPGQPEHGQHDHQPHEMPLPEQDQQQSPRHAVSFLDDGNGQQQAELTGPPRKWWQKMFGRAPQGPSPEEIALQRDIRAVSQPWLGPRCVAVVNGKGGSGKTPSTALLSAVFALYGGGGVVAWDNNETRGTLGWRTEGSPYHDATVQDLIPVTQQLMDARAALSQISSYVHHQSEDKYDVLRSDPALLAAAQRLTTAQFRAVHDVMERYFRLTIMDSSNDESSYNYLNMLDVADQIVVATTTTPDHAEAGRLLLEALKNRKRPDGTPDEHSQALAQTAVVVVSQADRDEEDAQVVASRFRQIVSPEAVITIPFDPAIRQMQLRYNQLAPATQRAYLRSAAEVAERLNRKS